MVTKGDSAAMDEPNWLFYDELESVAAASSIWQRQKPQRFNAAALALAGRLSGDSESVPSSVSSCCTYQRVRGLAAVGAVGTGGGGTRTLEGAQPGQPRVVITTHG